MIYTSDSLSMFSSHIDPMPALVCVTVWRNNMFMVNYWEQARAEARPGWCTLTFGGGGRVSLGKDPSREHILSIQPSPASPIYQPHGQVGRLRRGDRDLSGISKRHSNL